MPVSMVKIRIVQVAVRRRLVAMWMGVRLLVVPVEVMRMLVVLVMDVSMIVLQRFVSMFVFMAFAHVQPHAHRHQAAGHPERPIRRLSEHQE